MNLYAWIIVGALIADHVLDMVADILNLRALRRTPPPEFADVYDSEAYANAQSYLRINTRFAWLSASLELLALFVFWFGRGFPLVDRLSRQFAQGPILQGLLFVGLLLLLKYLISLPFELYHTFVIEARFGFNKTTVRTFLLDQLKAMILAAILGGGLLAAVLAFFAFAGSWAWLYCWAVVVGFTVVIQFVAPRWIMPLFNRFTPLPDDALREALVSYARTVDFPLTEVFVVDGSRRSTKGNAFFTGFGRNKRVALFDTLVEKLSTTELVTVVAHEIGHFKKRHILHGMVLSLVHTGLLFFVLSIFLSHRGLFEAFYLEQMSVHAGLVLFGLLMSPIERVIGVLIYAWMRRNEYEADRFAVQTTGGGEAFINALKKLSRDHLDNLTPHPLYVILHFSHPPVLTRIRAITGP